MIFLFMFIDDRFFVGRLKTFSIMISYLGPPTFLPNASSFVTLDVEENEPIELQCPVTNSPDLSIQWSKNNEDLDPMWPSSNIVIKRFVLKIHQAHLADAGLYKCNVVNGFGNIQAQFRINIKCKYYSLLIKSIIDFV